MRVVVDFMLYHILHSAYDLHHIEELVMAQ